jgi:hypothetical protein
MQAIETSEHETAWDEFCEQWDEWEEGGLVSNNIDGIARIHTI